MRSSTQRIELVKSIRKLELIQSRLDAAVTRTALGMSRLVLRARWLIVLLMMAIGVLFQWGEQPSGQFDGLLTDRFLILGLAVPLLIGLLLTLLAITENERVRAVYTLDLQQNFGEQISSLSHLEELVDSIVKFPRRVLPATAASLHLFNAEEQRFELAGEWSLDGKNRTLLPPVLAPQVCKDCLPGSQGPAAPNGLSLCPAPQGFSPSGSSRLYYLPLVYQDQVVALLHVVLPAEATIPLSQMRALSAVATEMAMAISGVNLQQSVADQNEATLAERKRISQNLHDTLGQDISYLRLKLDQLSGEDALWEISAVKKELERMRDIASDAYLQVRATLDELHPSGQVDLAAGLLQQARATGSRANFSVRLNSEGAPVELPAQVKRQVLFICREALNNVEKYACAREVTFNLQWKQEELLLTLSDDGAGFDPRLVRPNGHYGLLIMQERAEDIRANIKINSRPGRGTQIVLRVPLQQNKELAVAL